MKQTRRQLFRDLLAGVGLAASATLGKVCAPEADRVKVAPVAEEWSVPWRFSKDHVVWNSQEVEINPGADFLDFCRREEEAMQELRRAYGC